MALLLLSLQTEVLEKRKTEEKYAAAGKHLTQTMHNKLKERNSSSVVLLQTVIAKSSVKKVPFLRLDVFLPDLLSIIRIDTNYDPLMRKACGGDIVNTLLNTVLSMVHFTSNIL